MFQTELELLLNVLAKNSKVMGNHKRALCTSFDSD